MGLATGRYALGASPEMVGIGGKVGTRETRSVAPACALNITGGRVGVAHAKNLRFVCWMETLASVALAIQGCKLGIGSSRWCVQRRGQGIIVLVVLTPELSNGAYPDRSVLRCQEQGRGW